MVSVCVCLCVCRGCESLNALAQSDINCSITLPSHEGFCHVLMVNLNSSVKVFVCLFVCFTVIHV